MSKLTELEKLQLEIASLQHAAEINEREKRHWYRLAMDLRGTLSYVAYHRLSPLGNTVMEALPDHWQKHVTIALNESGEPFHEKT